ncbi:MAG: peptide chain release factor N(5)-glutamine methyltransferase [Solobacterium sp.]|nr:peptide chain release factor N(5)-glutamine methyltransferase [Solobacterium sp.]
MTFAEAVRQYEKRCEACDVPAETVMAFLVEIAQTERYNLYLHYDEEMPEDLAAKFSAGMERILKQGPMAHVLGYSWFYGYKFTVNGDVLIPRPETEELCARILAGIDRCFPQGDVACVDVGTGSGAIAVTLACEEPRIVMDATDISEAALATARLNAENNGAKISFYAGDMLKPLIEAGKMYDVLVCNPPYIPSDEEMEHAVVDFEPHVALFGGEDGLKFYREVFADCRKVLKDKAFMAFEMGWNQREAMSALVTEALPEAQFEIRKDMNGKDRMLFVYFNCPEAMERG